MIRAFPDQLSPPAKPAMMNSHSILTALLLAPLAALQPADAPQPPRRRGYGFAITTKTANSGAVCLLYRALRCGTSPTGCATSVRFMGRARGLPS